MIKAEELKEGLTAYDEECPQFGQGLIITYEDDMVEIHYPDIEETVTYTKRDALKYLEIVR